MRRILLSAIVLFAAGAALPAQTAHPREPGLMMSGNVMYGPAVAAAPQGAAHVQLMNVEMSVDTVKGAPYSAQAVTETTQVLADGNRIQRKMTASVYRDSEGRTRREQTMAGFGPLGPADGPELIFVTDPVAGTSYVLDPRERVARKGHAARPVQIRHKLEEGQVRTMIEERRVFEKRAEVNVLKAAPPGESKTESLGRQIIEGVEAEGNRTVVFIAAGQIGNERPIEIVSEHWFSPELKVTVLSRTSDPRMGETVHRLTNISRAEPPRSLFEVPTDYTVK